jgi:hypothetical protein
MSDADHVVQKTDAPAGRATPTEVVSAATGENMQPGYAKAVGRMASIWVWPLVNQHNSRTGRRQVKGRGYPLTMFTRLKCSGLRNKIVISRNQAAAPEVREKTSMATEHQRLQETRKQQVPWRKWGPYLSERQWGTVREAYSEGGDAWNYFSHDQARSRAYRWGEDGLAGMWDEEDGFFYDVLRFPDGHCQQAESSVGGGTVAAVRGHDL